jgi:uncharacterized coiled-coil protein SlyX
MTDIKIGDRVRVIGDLGYESGGEGVVQSLFPQNGDDLAVDLDKGKYAGYNFSYRFCHVEKVEPPTVESLQEEIDMLQMTIDEGQEILGEKEERIAFLEYTLGLANELITEQAKLLEKSLAVEEVVGKVVDKLATMADDFIKKAMPRA